jgi:hypothetical protein
MGGLQKEAGRNIGAITSALEGGTFRLVLRTRAQPREGYGNSVAYPPGDSSLRGVFLSHYHLYVSEEKFIPRAEGAESFRVLDRLLKQWLAV